MNIVRMPRPSRKKPALPAPRLQQCAERYATLKAELQGLGFVCVGSVQRRYLECGKASCGCRADAANRHGPYHYWTRKIRGRTVSVLLTDAELPLYQGWVANSRTLDRLVRAMRRVSARAVAVTTRRPLTR
jgi:hypothetical protein